MTKGLAGSRVFLTGSDGFIGSHVTEALVRLGCEVRALTYYNSWNQIGWLADTESSVRKAIEFFPGDIRDSERMREGVKGCEYVIHLASLIAIPYSYVAPRAYIDTNVSGTLNILNACRDSDCLVRLVHTSTSEVYGSAQQVPIPESHPLVGQSPYSASKIGADKIAESFHLSFDLPVVIARPFNTFGSRQTARAVIPTIASQLAGKVPTLHLGSLEPTRDFNFVADTAEGILRLADCKEAEGEVVNIGTGEEWSIGQVVEMLGALAGYQPEIKTETARIRPEKSEVNRLCADNTKLQSLTGWRPDTPFETGLEATFNWISQNLKYFQPDDYAI